MKLKIEYLIIIGLVVYIILLSTCNSKPVETKETKVFRTDSIYVYITDTIESIVRVPMASVEIHDTVYLYGSTHNYIYWKHDSLYNADRDWET